MTAPAQIAELDDLRPGLSVAGCRLVRVLEDGGSACSYLARYLETSNVLVKLFDSRLVGAGQEAANSYRWECEALLDLRHKALAQTVGFGRDETLGCGYLVQEFVPGIRIAALRRALRRPFTPAEASELLLPIADALIVCHRAGVSHGHLTALHVMLQPRAPVPIPRLVGLRPRLTPDIADTEDTQALSILAYAMTARAGEQLSSLPEILAGAPSARASHDERWNALLLMGLQTTGEERMVKLRDGLADVLATQPSDHRETGVLAEALPPLDPSLEDPMSQPVRLPEQFVPPRVEDEDTGPTTLWVSPDAPFDEIEAAWADHVKTPPPARDVGRPLYDASSRHVPPDEAPTRPHLRVAPPPVATPLSSRQELDPTVIASLKGVPEPSRESLLTTEPRDVDAPLTAQMRDEAPVPAGLEAVDSTTLVWIGAFACALIGAGLAILVLAV